MMMVSQGQCFLLCSTLMFMVSGYVDQKEVSCGGFVYLNPPVSLENTQSVVWSFRKKLFVNQPCADASKDNEKVQSQWELFPNGSLKLSDVTHSDQGYYEASIRQRNFSAIVKYEVYMHCNIPKNPKNHDYENENIPSPHIYVNEGASFEIERTESINSNRHYETLAYPDGALYNQLNNAPAVIFFQPGNRPQGTFYNIRPQA
ncbi:uncharacterized protein [Phyllobates terribilis]|uniref:uncharacterized protein isoform X3 n=1 Tax=Phyllobates terribilis TaxID=111132 RepID=UPI003CCAFFA7